MRARLVATAFILIVSAQSFAQTRRPAPTPRPVQTSPDEASSASEQDVDRFKIATDLITIPVVASTRDGMYVADLRKEEFEIFEDRTKQEVAFFATVSAPFHVVLMLDTSASTHPKLQQIQDAAIAFVAQLQGADRVKVISFDDTVKDLNPFTSDKTLLSVAIRRTTSGRDTKLYDAMDLALSALSPIKGRKAIVLFTDGVDYHSDRAAFDDALRMLDESGVIVYPIRYDTRAAAERLVREQTNGPELPVSDVVRKRPGTTPPTFPGGDAVPGGDVKPPEGITRLPPPSVILGGRTNQPDNSNGRSRDDRIPDIDRGTSRRPMPDDPGSTRRPAKKSGPDDAITHILDSLYLIADTYLEDLANKSGGRLARADTLTSLPDAFKNIAAELRTQYSLGYYSTNKAKDGSYRKIQVKTSRKDTSIRAKPGYRAPIGN
ncbi:MAG: Ca-activated chloride channel [Blastocatellia bacterium]|jgi:Ca-activated chloride channel family protein|nr:Ca-activated chloride channel [Blastocatellia bacterium]